MSLLSFVDFAQIESFTVSNLSNDMTVYPQDFKLNCVKIGYLEYDIIVIIGNTAVANLTGCNDDYSPCPHSVILDNIHILLTE